MTIANPDENAINKAVRLLREGLLVSFPTETVYGLGADASNIEAMRLLYRVKGRPTNHPVIVHISDAAKLSYWASRVPDSARLLAARFWPGPMTLILPRAEHVLDEVTGGQPTIGLRVPRHPVALSLLERFEGGVAAPSANRFGKLSPTRAEDVERDLGNDVAMILDGGPCQVGIESTIIDLSGSAPRLLRPGMLLPGEIENCLGEKLAPKELCASGDEEVRAPGGLPSHYAPRTPLKLLSERNLRSAVADAIANNIKFAVLAFSQKPAGLGEAPWLVAERQPEPYARALYDRLRNLDKLVCDWILVEEPPSGDGWLAIHDRLSRAAHVESSEGS